MNIETAAMRGRLSEAKETAARLRLRIEGNCRAIRTGLNTALTPVENLEVPMMAEQMDELTAAWGELQTLLSTIDRLEKELA